jgi:hypothetical protein
VSQSFGYIPKRSTDFFKRAENALVENRAIFSVIVERIIGKKKR